MSDHYTFLSWVRDGAAAQISQPETLSTTLPSRALLDVDLDLPSSTQQSEPPVNVKLALYGPGDVKSLDRDEIVRVEPQPNSSGFEPNYVPAIEFRRADLPWLFSPMAGTDLDQQKLRPWLALVVVPAETAKLQLGRRGQPHQIHCPVAELPELTDSWAWAHAQITNLEPDENLHDILEHQPARAISRLIGARRLEAGRRYIACVVPTFKAGVEAALGNEVKTKTLTPAWSDSEPEMIDLPVYYHWSFGTGEAGDFEALVSRLMPHAITSGTAVRQLDVSDPGAGVIVTEPGDPAELLPFAGALAAEGHAENPWATQAGERFETELKEKFNAVADAQTEVVGPPLYGRFYAGQDRILDSNQSPHWFKDLNLDPRLRAYASLGVQTVQKHQEALMASAWDQLDEVEAVNQALRQAQLARGVSDGIMRHRIRNLRDTTLMQLTRSAHTKVTLNSKSVADALAESDMPNGTATSAMRRLVRPHGSLVRRSRQYVPLDSHAFASELVTGTISIKSRVSIGKGMVPLDDLTGSNNFLLVKNKYGRSSAEIFTSEVLRDIKKTYSSSSISQWLEKAPRTKGIRFRRLTSAVLLRTTKSIERAFDAAIALMERQDRLEDTPREGKAQLPDAAGIAAAVKSQLDPKETIAAFTTNRIEAGTFRSGDPIEPIMAAPYFPQPMYEVLQEMEPGFFLTGAEGLPPDSISLVQANGAFMYAYMIGLNHGMGSELLWRGFPTDQRGTYFRRFWDRAGNGNQSFRDQPSDEAGAVDIPPLHELPSSLRLLGDNPGAASDYLTLVIRGEFLHRYPNAWLYAQKAVFKGDKRELSSEAPRMPIFSGKLGDDAAFFAFDLTLEEARGDANNPGWFMVFREPPTDVRFGLDASAVSSDTPKRLDDLAWNHVLKAGDRYANIQKISPSHPFEDDANPQTRDLEPVIWATNGAHIARCFMQWPVSVAFHAEALLPNQ